MKLPVFCVVLGSTVAGIRLAASIKPTGSVHNKPYVEEIWGACETAPERGLALIQVNLPAGGVKPISKQNKALLAAHVREEEQTLLGKSEDMHRHDSLVFGPVKPVSKDDVVRILGITRDDLCPARGDNAGVGCTVGCRCGWWKQCYPKTMLVANPGPRRNSTSENETSQIQVGVCDLAPPVLMLLSVFILLGAILFFAVARFVAMLPGHYGLEPKHREIHKPQRGQEDSSARSYTAQGWRNSRPPVEDFRRLKLQQREDDEAEEERGVEVQQDSKCRQHPMSSGTSSAESSFPQAATAPEHAHS